MILSAFDVILYFITFVILFLSVFWLLVFLTTKDKPKPVLTGALPRFTAIVPAWNEEKAILKTLDSLTQLDYPRNLKQIIVVNDGSTDRTQALVESYIASHPNDPITLINQENKGKAAAMNVALAQATGEFFACLDADSFVEKNALLAMLPYFNDEGVAAVCPLLKVQNPSSLIEKVQWYEYIVNMFHKQLNGMLDCIHVTPGPFSMYRTKVIQDLGGYDEGNITEDLEIAIRLQKHQYKILQVFSATVYTNTPLKWKDLFRQRVRWYRGSVDNALRYKSMMFNKKYGDFGFLRLPTTVTSGIFTVLIMGFFLKEGFTWIWRNVTWLQAINFDIWPLLMNWQFELDLLMLPYSRYFIGLMVLSISLFVMIYSYKLVGERITNHGRTLVSLSFYLLLYSFFLSIVWMYIGFQLAVKGKTKW